MGETKNKGLEKSLNRTLVDDIINQGNVTIDAMKKQQASSIQSITTQTNLEITRVGGATDAKKVELETKKDEMLEAINVEGGKAVTSGIATLNTHTDNKKVDLNNHEKAKEIQLNELYSTLEEDLRRLATEAIMDKGVIANGIDWHNLTQGNYYVADLAGSGYLNAPKLDLDENAGVVLVSTSGRNNYKVIRYYSIKKRMHFMIKTLTTWSEWSTVSEGGSIKYEYTQPNHGFTFNAVQLDGVTNRWVLADKTTSADGIAVRITNDRFQLLIDGDIAIPNATRDSAGNVLIADEFYFLSNSQAGGFDREKPQNIFQSLFRTYIDEQNRLCAQVDIDTPVELVPRILVDEINAIGLQLKEDSRLQTTSKSVVGGINENKISLSNKQDKVDNRLTTTSKNVVEAINFINDSKENKERVFKNTLTDLNTIKTESKIAGFNWTNSPENSSIAVMDTKFYSSDWIVQEFTSIATLKKYTRRFFGGNTWSDWFKTYASNDVPKVGGYRLAVNVTSFTFDFGQYDYFVVAGCFGGQLYFQTTGNMIYNDVEVKEIGSTGYNSALNLSGFNWRSFGEKVGLTRTFGDFLSTTGVTGVAVWGVKTL